jgi:hypothetical protein
VSELFDPENTEKTKDLYSDFSIISFRLLDKIYDLDKCRQRTIYTCKSVYVQSRRKTEGKDYQTSRGKEQGITGAIIYNNRRDPATGVYIKLAICSECYGELSYFSLSFSECVKSFFPQGRMS